jgi:hypothetical protein
MNERIKQLAEQAGFDKHHVEYDTRIERFAELVRQDERELKELKPVAYFCSRTNSASTNSHHGQDKNWTPLYALEAELAKPEQEPIGWFLKDHLETYMESYKDIEGAIPLYTSPRKEWKELTHAQISLMISSHTSLTDLCRTVEAKLKEKNT